MKDFVLTIFCIVFSFHNYAQKKLKSEQEHLLSTIEITLNYLKTKDTVGLSKICLDSVWYFSTDETKGLSTREFIPFSSLLVKDLNLLLRDKNLQKAIKRKHPKFYTTIVILRDGTEIEAECVSFTFKNFYRRTKVDKFKTDSFTFIGGKLFCIGVNK